MGIPENIKRLRVDRKMSQPELARLAGVSQQLISQLENGKNTSTKYLPKIARALGVSMGEVDPEYVDPGTSTIGPAFSRPGAQPPFAGYVRAGLFETFDPDFQQDYVAVPDFVQIQPGYARIRQYAYQAKGDSMTEAGIADGMWVVAADAADFIDQHGDLESGDLVVVERTKMQRAEREMTVKEIHFFKDRYELRPRTTNPDHKAIVVKHDLDVDADGIEVKIVGVVLTAYTDFRRKRRAK
jgi:transcriptional regulator with XRE-family HTH domain